MAPASSPGRPRIALVDAYNQALERLGKVLNKQEIEHRLVTAFAHRDIDVIGWYRIEDGESFSERTYRRSSGQGLVEAELTGTQMSVDFQ
ncbi:MAG: hypothetical protein NVV74_15925 [Magnetospirillum sp.]|nr:hypothetical protein [Magnetospirillum sp.]